MAKLDLTEGSVSKTILRLTFPMLFGMLSIVMYNMADTLFVGRLGKDELAALSFTFPVVGILGNIAFGIGIGAMSLVSTAVGRADDDTVKRLTSDVLLLSILIAIVFSVCGYFTMIPLFRLIGAKGRVLELVCQYMGIWYLGAGFVVIPMVGNNIIRATGDARTPAVVMSISGILNVILDPLFIFGLGPFPELGVKGAALATVISRSVTFVVSLSVLYFREKILSFRFPGVKVIINSWRRVLYIGLPAVLTRIFKPLSNATITRMIAFYGNAAVAGFGLATRLEFFALLPIKSVGSAIMPFAGLNLGAGKPERIKKAIKFSWLYSFLCGIGIFILSLLFSEKAASLFNSDPTVIDTASRYMIIVSSGYGLSGIVMIMAGVLNIFRKPILSSFISLLQMFIIYIPLAYVLSRYIDLNGIFLSRPIAFLLTAIIGFFFIKKDAFSVLC